MLDAKSLFDESYYDTANPDVASAIAKGQITSGWQHFQLFGDKEGRNPSAFFNTQFYLSEYNDVANAVKQGYTTAFDHYIANGQKEGRDGSVLFDDNYYLSHNADVQSAVTSSASSVDPLTGIQHYIQFGLKEGRAGSIEFDPTYYINNNADLKADNLTNYQAAEHFVLNGENEGR